MIGTERRVAVVAGVSIAATVIVTVVSTAVSATGGQVTSREAGWLLATALVCLLAILLAAWWATR